MLESPQSGKRIPVLQAEESAAALALRVHAVAPLSDVQDSTGLTAEFVAALHDASLKPQSDSFDVILGLMRGAGISDQQISDLYLPTVARNLGEEWAQDSKTFSEVTIGVARLQRLLHDLGPEWRTDLAHQPDAPAVLVLTGSKADHTFGARIIRGQLRRRGFSVRLSLGLRPDQVKTLMGKFQFDAVMISASLTEDPRPLKALVDAVRSAANPVPPIVLGGTICARSEDIKSITGADFVTSEIEDAVRFCALDAPTHQTRTLQPRTPQTHASKKR